MRRFRLLLGLLIGLGASAVLLGVLPRGWAPVTTPAAAAPAAVPARGPYLGNQTITSVQVIWLTAVPTDTVLRYGIDLIYSYELTSPAPVTTHVVSLAGLQPGTVYFYA